MTLSKFNVEEILKPANKLQVQLASYCICTRTNQIPIPKQLKS